MFQDSLWHVKDDGTGTGQTYVSNGQYEPHPESDYAHYPRPEEYLVQADSASKLWQYTCGNGDQYAVPNKIKTHEQLNGKYLVLNDFIYLWSSKLCLSVTMWYNCYPQCPSDGLTITQTDL